jgi:S-adenosyl-L-methionine hydrolase (adenosine-forming)
MARPVVALLSDFGLHDHYVGTMKGVMLGICPDITLVDISHDVPPHDVLAGGLMLAACYRYFPQGTIFLIVVDPGVGSARRAIAVDTAAYRFVAPDNGVLSPVLDAQPSWRAVQLTEARYATADVSRTFEGRDRFAPAAAWLASGVDIGALGPSITELRRLPQPPVVTEAGTIRGEVVRVDRFGNLITNIDRRTFEGVSTGLPDVRVGGRQVARVVATYAEIASGEVCALFGSDDRLEIAANGASAAALLDVGRGAAVHVVGARDSMARFS